MQRWLYVYRAPSGEWAGRVIEGDEVAGIGGCESADEALAELREQFPDAEILPGSDPA